MKTYAGVIQGWGDCVWRAETMESDPLHLCYVTRVQVSSRGLSAGPVPVLAEKSAAVIVTRDRVLSFAPALDKADELISEAYGLSKIVTGAAVDSVARKLAAEADPANILRLNPNAPR